MDSGSDTSTMVPGPRGQLCWASEDLLLAQQAGRMQVCREKGSVYIRVCVYTYTRLHAYVYIYMG